MIRRTRAATEALTIDEIASMRDTDAVRREFDATNTRLMALIASLFFLGSIPPMLEALRGRDHAAYVAPISIAHFLFATVAAAFFIEMAIAQTKRGAWKQRLPIHLIRANLTAWIIAYLIIEFALTSSMRSRGNNSWMAWAITMPLLLIGIRLAITRRAAVHLALYAMFVLNVTIIGSNDKSNVPDFIGIGIISTMAFIAGAIISRRARLATIDEWSERRTYATEQLRMRDELRYAREVQLSMLPERAPELEWLDIAGSSQPATEVGGDYFDYFPDRDAIALVCGDVAGHGLASGIVLTSLRSGFTLLRRSLRDPAAVLQQLNDLVLEMSRRRMLVTVAVVLLDGSARKATIASAGHPPVMVRRNGTVAAIELFGPPLGVRLAFNVSSTSLDFASGDLFVLHSDGLYEAQNSAGESYGLERLQRVIASADGSAAEVRDAILRDLEEFRGGVAQSDDVTVVVARVL